MALAAAISAIIWYLVEPIVVTHDTFAYLIAAKFIAGVDGGSFTYFRPPLLPLLMAVTSAQQRAFETQNSLGMAVGFLSKFA